MYNNLLTLYISLVGIYKMVWIALSFDKLFDIWCVCQARRVSLNDLWKITFISGKASDREQTDRPWKWFAHAWFVIHKYIKNSQPRPNLHIEYEFNRRIKNPSYRNALAYYLSTTKPLDYSNFYSMIKGLFAKRPYTTQLMPYSGYYKIFFDDVFMKFMYDEFFPIMDLRSIKIIVKCSKNSELGSYLLFGKINLASQLVKIYSHETISKLIISHLHDKEYDDYYEIDYAVDSYLRRAKRQAT